jgi:tetratricopeptide (TPR) repeat protein
LLEDELGVASFLDFTVRLLKAILAWYPEKTEVARGLEEVYDLPASRQSRRAVELLLEAAADKDLLIIMENLGVTFDSKQGFGRKGQQALRDLVQQHPRIMLFASAQALLDGVSEPNAPFYEFFHITRLSKLTLEEVIALIEAIAAAYGNSDVSGFLNTPEGRARVRAIYDFTGGNHRLLVTFYDFLAADSLTKLSDAFIEALKPLKPYYQEQMRALSAQQQKIVQYLSLERLPKTVKEIARGCLATSNTVSSQMQGLMDKGFVARIPQGRETYYEISETLFRICYEADLDHKGAPIRLFVDFLGNFYTAQELQVRARGFRLLARALDTEAPSHESEAALYRQALLRYHPAYGGGSGEEIRDLQEELRKFFQDLTQHADYREIISFAKKLPQSKDSVIALAEANAYAEVGDTAKACELLEAASNKKPEELNLRIGLAHFLFRAGYKERAFVYAKKVTEMAPNNPDGWERCAVIAFDLGKVDDAETYCRRALEVSPANEAVRRVLVRVLDSNGRSREALETLETLRAAGSLTEGDYLRTAGAFYYKLDETTAAEAAWRRALEIEPTNIDLHFVLAAHFLMTDRPGEALERYTTVTKLAPDHVGAYLGAAMALEALDHQAEAEVQYRSALSLEPGNVFARLRLAALLRASGRNAEAIEILERALSFEPRNTEALIALGKAYRDSKDIEKAEASYRSAAALESAEAASLLSWLLIETGRASEALEFIQNKHQADLDPVLLASVFEALGQMDQAKSLLRQALEAEPANVRAGVLLTRLLGADNQWNEVIQHLSRLQEAAPHDARLFLLSGLANLEAGDVSAAERELRRAVDLDAGLTDPLTHLARLLTDSKREEEAIQMLSASIQKADTIPAHLMRGELYVRMGNLESAASDYGAVLRQAPKNKDALFGLSMVRLGEGNVHEAADLSAQGLELNANSIPNEKPIVQELHKALTIFFAICTRAQMPVFLERVLDSIVMNGRNAAFDQALSLVTFALLKMQERLSEERFTDILWALENLVSKYTDVSVCVAFLTVGVDYFKRGNRKALMKLSREERALFTEQLGIEPAA